jgi:tetratricopeptide (TPR) repeat protein
LNGNQQSALAAMKSVEPHIARLDGSQSAEDRAADILELWQGTEKSLRALMGGSQLSGQGLIRELRQRELISLGQAYALLEFLGARDRANRTTYKATDNDVVVAREGFRQLEAGLTSAAAMEPPPVAQPTPTPLPPAPSAPPPQYAPPPAQPYAPPAASASPYARPSTPPPPSYSPPPAYSPPPVSPPAAAEPTYAPRPSRSPANLWFIVALVVLLGAAIGGYALFARRSSPEKQMNEAVADMQTGKREAARGGFTQIARENPNLATPHIFLSRMAREEGDLGTARRELETAIRLEPGNAIALREMGLILFSAGNYELARRFFVRALNVNPDDKASMGYLGCALSRLNRFDEATKFINRAGPGSWSTCLPAGPPTGPM